MSGLTSDIGPLLHLGALPVFQGLPPYQLAALAREVQEEVIPDGARLLGVNDPAQSAHLVLEGRLRAWSPAGGERIVGPGNEVGLMEVLAGEVAGTEISALGPTATLVLDGDVLRDAAERYAAVLLRLLREVAGRLLERPPALMAALGGPDTWAEPLPDLDRVGRILALHRAPALPSSSMDALAELAGPPSERTRSAGASLWKSPPVNACWVICAGEVRIEGADGAAWGILGPGSIPGVVNLLRGEARPPYQAVAETPVVALEIQREALLDAVEDHFELGWGILAGLASHVVRP